jgi:hypothetical protein
VYVLEDTGRGRGLSIVTPESADVDLSSPRLVKGRLVLVVRFEYSLGGMACLVTGQSLFIIIHKEQPFCLESRSTTTAAIKSRAFHKPGSDTVRGRRTSLALKRLVTSFFLTQQEQLCHSLIKMRYLQHRITCTKPRQAERAKGKGKGKTPTPEQKPKTTSQNNQQKTENN